ncbi:MAG: ABC transporter permease [Sulfolobales archaeon]
MEAFFRSVLVIARYEVRRALARKKVLAGVLLIVASQILGVYAYSEILRTVRTVRTAGLPMAPEPSLAWIFSYFLPSYFLSGLAALIASGSFSEEFEKGHSELLFTKPVTRLEIFLGKLLGGYGLQAFFVVLFLILSLIASSIAFGPQSEVGLAPEILVANIYSNMVFFSIAMALSIITKNTLISSTVPLALLLFLPFISGILIFLERSTGASYSLLVRLPTWGSLLQAYIIPAEILQKAFIVSPLVLALYGYGDPLGAAISVAGYSILFFSISLLKILYEDIPRRS